ncbi:NAD(P)H-hydrate epimerase [Rhodobacter xanthinilyticus]|uniref:NAD(P)H-hydrate epimerase n=2 Tax=Rhodobacter xanthinilyticus TaxID=1850250 RepID=A0A1D9MBQ5_9RHOB|nr:NAD(P)H-hydrate epimerase [Rhodobacter xanthinilyticus]
MRATEAAAIAAGRVTGLALMERAGAATITAIFETWPARAAAPGHALVLCGPGNNGGDGFVVARLLAARGWQVTVRFFGRVETQPPDARVNHDRWAELGPVLPLDPAAPPPLSPAPDLVIDALFGIGLSRPLEIFAPLFAALGACGAPVVAVDLPSGREADARPEAAAWPACPADLIVTFHRAKPAHAALAPGAMLRVMDIGL